MSAFFESYVLRREARLMGFRICLSMYVDCRHKEVDLRLLVDGRITPLGANGPHWWEVDTPEKAADWFRRVDMDLIAERMYLERFGAERKVP